MKALRLLALIAVGVGLATAAPAQSVEEFYKGKTITVYIGYSPGGGYDRYARTVGRHIGKHIPGNPDIVPKNRPTVRAYSSLPPPVGSSPAAPSLSTRSPSSCSNPASARHSSSLS